MPELEPERLVALALERVRAGQAFGALVEALDRLSDELVKVDEPELAGALLADCITLGRNLDRAGDLIPGVQAARAASVAGVPATPDAPEGE